MKTIWLLFSVLFTPILFAQDFIPMLDEGNSWSVDTFYCPFMPDKPPYDWTVTEHLTINGTQEINGKTYKQIYNGDNISCLLREEDGVVYKVNGNEENVMFDFNFEVGDVYNMIGSGFIDPYCSGNGWSPLAFSIEVFEIETLFIAGADRKVIKFMNHSFPAGEEVRWIEGIGTRAGLALPWPNLDITCWSVIACFTTEEETYFMNGATSCDNTTLGIDDFSKVDAVLYPHPVTAMSVLQFPIDAQIDTIKIFDLSGKLIEEEQITSDHFTFDVMNYRSGLYFYQLLSNNQVIISNKVIIK